MRYFFGGVMSGNQQVIITDKSRIEINSVICVKAFDEEGVLLETALGNICVEGSDLRIENFEKASTGILIVGNISGLYYVEKRMKKKGRGAIH